MALSLHLSVMMNAMHSFKNTKLHATTRSRYHTAKLIEWKSTCGHKALTMPVFNTFHLSSIRLGLVSPTKYTNQSEAISELVVIPTFGGTGMQTKFHCNWRGRVHYRFHYNKQHDSNKFENKTHFTAHLLQLIHVITIFDMSQKYATTITRQQYRSTITHRPSELHITI